MKFERQSTPVCKKGSHHEMVLNKKRTLQTYYISHSWTSWTPLSPPSRAPLPRKKGEISFRKRGTQISDFAH